MSGTSAKALNEFLPLDALTEALGVSKPVVLAWVRDRGLPAIHIGSRWLFHEPSVAGWLKGHERAVQDPPGPDAWRRSETASACSQTA
jgi:excisionase family DNA binding protein